MKKFYRKLKGWKKFWFWVIVLVLMINFSQLVDYTLTKTIWNYTKNNGEISLLTKIIFPSPSIISEKKKIGFMADSFAPISKKDLSLEKFNNFSEYRLSYKERTDWLHRTMGGFFSIILVGIAIIIEWFYFFFWQIIVKIFIWECLIKFLLWEFIIKSFLWEFLLKGLIWGVVIRDFIWGFLLSGSWLK
jgi:hypothetical protein